MNYDGLYVTMACGCRINETRVFEMCGRHAQQIKNARREIAEWKLKINEALSSPNPTPGVPNA